MIKNKKLIITVSLLLLSIFIIFISKNEFEKMFVEEIIYPGEGVTDVINLSKYNDFLVETAGDTKIYVLEGEIPGPSVLVIGGTHPSEPASNLSSLVLVEKAKVKRGRLFVITRANNSAFTNNEPLEASPQRYYIKTPSGKREFILGSRATNPVDQWPDSEIFIHIPSMQKLAGIESRNLNRNYPGIKNGNVTQRVAYAITQLIKEEDIKVTIDLHEASPEYPVVNAMVAHERSMELASIASLNMEIEGMSITIEPSPKNLHGLSHRELGDFTETLPILLETANPSQGRLKGANSGRLVVTGEDKMYEKADRYNRLFVPYNSGYHIEERVFRHLTSILSILDAYNTMYSNSFPIEIEGIPSYHELHTIGIGVLLDNKNK